MPPLTSWLPADPLSAARALLGATVVHDAEDGRVAVLVTETEAYDGPFDPASHAHRGPTARNAVMFGAAGLLYVYRSHGLHWCANVTTGNGDAGAVLLRAARVVEGRELARRRRGSAGAAVPDVRLARGPGNLAQALGLTGDHDGLDLEEPEDPGAARHGVRLLAPAHAPTAVRTGPRVGVRLAPDVPYRCWLADEPTVSALRRNPRAAPPVTGDDVWRQVGRVLPDAVPGDRPD